MKRQAEDNRYLRPTVFKILNSPNVALLWSNAIFWPDPLYADETSNNMGSFLSDFAICSVLKLMIQPALAA